MTKAPAGKESAYRALGRELRQGLLDRTYDGGRLPTEAELAATHGVSRQTVRRAMQELVADGMIVRVRGRGTFPAPAGERYLRQLGSVEDLMAMALDTDLQLVVPLHRRVDPEAAGRLRQASDSVASLSVLRVHQGLTFCYTTVYLSPQVGQHLEDVAAFNEEGSVTRTTVLETLDKNLDIPIVMTDQSITVAALPQAPATALGLDAGQSAMRIDRVYFGENEVPIELAVSWFHPERYSYRVRLRRNHM